LQPGDGVHYDERWQFPAGEDVVSNGEDMRG